MGRSGFGPECPFAPSSALCRQRDDRVECAPWQASSTANRNERFDAPRYFIPCREAPSFVSSTNLDFSTAIPVANFDSPLTSALARVRRCLSYGLDSTRYTQNNFASLEPLNFVARRRVTIKTKVTVGIIHQSLKVRALLSSIEVNKAEARICNP